MHPMGETALLIDVMSDPAAYASGVRAHCETLDVRPIDVVPAARTVLITFRSRQDLETVAGTLDRVVPVAEQRAQSSVEIPVRYDGEDLPEVARLAGLSVDAVVELHLGAEYRAAFCGFAPGFAYLDGLPDQLHLPRRATPRTSVPTGSVAIASGQTAVYPRASPGGWHLIGCTELTMFDPQRRPPALVMPGATVRFVPA